MKLKILYSDDAMLVIDKPAGLIVDPNTTSTEITLAQILQEEYQIPLERGGVVHRLDKDTSGILLAAKTSQALEVLQSQFKERTIKKVYTALVHGIIDEEGRIVEQIARNPSEREKFMVVDKKRDPNLVGKEAVTRFKRTQKLALSEETLNDLFEEFNKIQFKKLRSSKYSEFSLISAFPETGRTHQIRVHLKYIGYPIVADQKYTGRRTVRLDHRWCPRQFLHASKIEFDHPIKKQRLNFESPLPDDLQSALNLLQKVE